MRQALVLLGLTLLPAVAAADHDILRDREAAFQHAVEHLDAGRFPEGISILRRLNEAHPGGRGVLWNLGQATSRIGEHREALAAWLAYRALEPDHWHVHAKLVQTYEALGERVARDREREALYRLRKAAPPDSDLARLDRYVREQFTISGRRVMAFEFFEPAGPRQIFYSFVVVSPTGDEAFRISLGSYEWTTRHAWETGVLPRDQRLFHLDGYDRDSHTTHAFFEGALPSYERVRDLVRKIIVDR